MRPSLDLDAQMTTVSIILGLSWIKNLANLIWRAETSNAERRRVGSRATKVAGTRQHRRSRPRPGPDRQYRPCLRGGERCHRSLASWLVALCRRVGYGDLPRETEGAGQVQDDFRDEGQE